jgi:hypothetical protein
VNHKIAEEETSIKFREITGSTTESARIFGRKLRAGDCVNRNVEGQ